MKTTDLGFHHLFARQLRQALAVKVKASLKLASVFGPMRETQWATRLVGPVYESRKYRRNMAAQHWLRCLQFHDATTPRRHDEKVLTVSCHPACRNATLAQRRASGSGVMMLSGRCPTRKFPHVAIESILESSNEKCPAGKSVAPNTENSNR